MPNKITEFVREIYTYRHLLFSMVLRNLKGRYKSSYLGFAWHFITPAVLIALFYIVFTSVMGKSVENYWVYLCIGMFPFTFFQDNLIAGSACITSSASTINKMYFPREIIVLAQVISTFITFIMAYSIVIVLMLVTGIPLDIRVIPFLPLILSLSIMFAIGFVLILSSLSVFMRDIQHLVSAFSRALFWITPIFYMTADLGGVLAEIIWYNPLTYFITSYHDILYFGVVPGAFQLSVCVILAFATPAIGLLVFTKYKKRFSEVL